MLPLGSSKYRRNQAGHRPPIDVNDVDDDEDGVDDGGSDFQRSSSEGRLVDQWVVSICDEIEWVFHACVGDGVLL